tara:strand:+ start:613 stop:843 length:231 start_codon:yes stop_codon:yes gene_type:complete
MKSPFKELLGILLVGAFISLLAYGLNYLQRPNALENVEKRLDEAVEKESVLTDNEKKLKTEAETKEWEEIDKQTDK